MIDEAVRAGIPGLWQRDRDDRRPNPYLFPKLKSSLTADDATIVSPVGREMIDFECELVAVIGRPARRVPVDRALDYVFGDMAMVDVSNRQDRADALRFGLADRQELGHVRSERAVRRACGVYRDPQSLSIRYTLNGKLMQDANTASTIHTVSELVAYASSIATLQPGDLIGTGTPGGVGEGCTPPVYLQAHDESACAIENVGELNNRVARASAQ